MKNINLPALHSTRSGNETNIAHAWTDMVPAVRTDPQLVPSTQQLEISAVSDTSGMHEIKAGDKPAWENHMYLLYTKWQVGANYCKNDGFI